MEPTKIGQVVAKACPDSIKLARLRPKCWAHVLIRLPAVADVLQRLLGDGQTRPDLGRKWPDLGQVWTILGGTAHRCRSTDFRHCEPVARHLHTAPCIQQDPPERPKFRRPVQRQPTQADGWDPERWVSEAPRSKYSADHLNRLLAIQTAKMERQMNLLESLVAHIGDTMGRSLTERSEELLRLTRVRGGRSTGSRGAFQGSGRRSC